MPRAATSGTIISQRFSAIMISQAFLACLNLKRIDEIYNRTVVN
jgi:hypothetical protein